MDDMTVEVTDFSSCAESYCEDHEPEVGVGPNLLHRMLALLPDGYSSFEEYERYCPNALKAAFPTIDVAPTLQLHSLGASQATAPMTFTLSIRPKADPVQTASASASTPGSTI